jgi:hypothetical protein
VEIFDVMGIMQNVEVKNQNAESEIILDISELQAGIYFIKIIMEQGTLTKKVIKH